jgi:hypothetical protein
MKLSDFKIETICRISDGEYRYHDLVIIDKVNKECCFLDDVIMEGKSKRDLIEMSDFSNRLDKEGAR